MYFSFQTAAAVAQIKNVIFNFLPVASWGCNTAVTRFERGVEGSYPPNLDVLKV